MTITRTINGVVEIIELTNDEMWQAFHECEHMNDFWEAQCWYEDEFDEDELHEIARIMRRDIDKYGMDEHYALDDAVAEFRRGRGYIDDDVQP